MPVGLVPWRPGDRFEEGETRSATAVEQPEPLLGPAASDEPLTVAGAAPKWPALARGAVLAIAVLLLCRDIGAPFNGWHQLNDAAFTQFARNHIQYGLRYTALYNTWGDTLAPPAVPQRYLSHPPLLSLWTALPLVVFGDHEWAARLVPIAATLGSTALLMAIVSGLAGPLGGVLAGFFFVTLPLSAYFGRMIDHEAPAQLFSLLMVHGYLHWTGGYGAASRRGRGVAAYVCGALLGAATAWSVLVAAGLVWTLHLLRVLRRRGDARLLLWLAAAPALATAAVLAHIAAASGWDVSLFRSLAERRSFGGEGGQQPWGAWAAMQAAYFVRNFTWPGALAAIAAPALLARRRALAAFAALCGAHGLSWVVLLKNQSWFHDYWQFFLAPYVAIAMAVVVLAVHRSLARRAPRLAATSAALLLVAPAPFAAASLDFYPRHVLVDPDYVGALVRLRELVPPRAPVWTSHRLRESAESFGGYTYRWPQPVVAYYANRPLFFSRDAAEIRANAPRCAAYVLKRSDQPWARELERDLSRSFAAFEAGEQHVIFLLNRPNDDPRVTAPGAGARD